MVELSQTSAPRLTRRIQSFVRREGRLTPAQKRALETLWPLYGLDTQAPFDADRVFCRQAPLILEIGFGNGESLVEMACSHPHFNYLGIEVHRPGVGHLLLALKRYELNNVRIYCADAVEILRERIQDQALQRINIFFPDPWPKKRHHKRRLIQPDFVSMAMRKLQPDGFLHLATDWPDYARTMQEAVATCPALHPIPASRLHPARPGTKFEKRGLRLGHRVTDLAYIKCIR